MSDTVQVFGQAINALQYLYFINLAVQPQSSRADRAIEHLLAVIRNLYPYYMRNNSVCTVPPSRQGGSITEIYLGFRRTPKRLPPSG